MEGEMNATGAGNVIEHPPIWDVPSASLLDALLALAVVSALGRVCSCAGLVQAEPGVADCERGAREMIGFIATAIALPALAFELVVSADISSLDWGVVVACTLGKSVVFGATLAIASSACCAPSGQRARVGAVFGLLAVASEDFAVGVPIVEALYPSRQDGSQGYVAINAAIGSMVFVPLSSALLALSRSKDGEGAHLPGVRACLAIARRAVLNPTVVGASLGLLYKAAHCLRDPGSANEELTPVLASTARLLSAPYVACTLFLAGARLEPQMPSLSAMLLVGMKVIACASASSVFGTLLVGRDSLRGLPFVYGALPTGGPMLAQLGPLGAEATKLASTAALFGFLAAGPAVFSAAVIHDIGGDPIAAYHVLAHVQLSISTASTVAGAVLVVLLALICRDWGYRNPARQLLSWYVAVGIVGQVLMLLLRPAGEASAGYCEEYKDVGSTSVATLILWTQNSCRLLLLALQCLLVIGPIRLVRRPWQTTAVAIACLFCGMAVVELCLPSGVREVCHRTDVPRRMSLVGSLVWFCVLLVGMAAMRLLGARRGGRSAEPEHLSPSDSDGSESDVESTERYTEALRLPRVTISVVTTVMVFRLLLQIANTVQVMHTGQPMGSFPEAFILETVLEQGQLVLLLLAVAFDSETVAQFAEIIARRWPSLCHLGSLQKDDAVELDIPVFAVDVPREDQSPKSQPLRTSRGGGALLSSPGTQESAAAPAANTTANRPKGSLCLVVTTTIYEPSGV